MTKYGWQHVAEEQGWQVLTQKRLTEDGWFGLISRSGISGISGAPTEAEVLDQLEAWWRAQVTA